MATTITSVQSNDISHAMFIDLEIGGNVYHISNAYTPITIGSDTYNELGILLGVTDFTDEIKATEGDITISVSGIPSETNYITRVLEAPILGGNVTLKRGFFHTNNSEIITNQVFTRFKGVITNFQLQEDTNLPAGFNTTGITFSVASLNTLLENKIAGQKTDPSDRDRFDATDKSFDRVPDLQNLQFDFGMPYKPGTGVGGGGGGGGRGGGGGGNRDRNRNVQER